MASCYGDPRLSDASTKTPQLKPHAKIKSNKNSSGKPNGPANTVNPQPWLLRKDPAHLTLQLTASRDQKAISNYIDSNKLGKQAAVYRYRRDDNTWFGVIYGSYPTRRQAETAAVRLKQTRGRTDPWVRKFAGIQKLISE